MSNEIRRVSLDALAGQSFDIVIIGGGVNGASIANHVSAAGYTTLVVEKGDFGSGASSRSSRLLHCGLNGLAPHGGSPWQFLLHPSQLRAGLKSAREMAQARAEFVRTMPERVRPFTFCYPIYSDGPYAGWQIDIALQALGRIGGTEVPLDYKRLTRAETLAHPVGRHLANQHLLKGMAHFREYQFEFAERMVLDTLLSAQTTGALSRNYTAVTAFRKTVDDWVVTLADQICPEAGPIEVRGKLLMNMTGAWIDRVNGLDPVPPGRDFIQRRKGVHIVLRLPDEMRDFGVYQFGKDDAGTIYVIPWRGMHYVGPTDLPFDGSLDDVKPTEADLEIVLKNFGRLFPSIPVSKKDIVYSWAGIQPRTFEPNDPHGSWSREFHRITPADGPQLFALTGATLGRSRMSGRDGLKLVQSAIAPSGKAGPLDYGAHQRAGRGDEIVHRRNSEDRIDLADIAYAVQHEQACTIEDVMFRRTGIGWDADMGGGCLPLVAREMGRLLNWSETRIEQETQHYLSLLKDRHRSGLAAWPQNQGSRP
ncbi:MAG: FAD-dependent oxidoreductase [Rhodobacteraceae bacterium]|jgi:glycerol-3-phosphate dehydrogenase|nr:FAD-dependent oxidoreductase [Paracoccaceae bacterium]